MLVLSVRDDTVFLSEVPSDSPDSRGLLKFEAASISLFLHKNCIFQDLGLEKTILWS